MNCLHILLYFPLESRNLENLSLNYLLGQLIVYCIVFHLISAGFHVKGRSLISAARLKLRPE